MENDVLLNKMEKALMSVAGEPAAFMNQHDFSVENVQVATYLFIQRAIERLSELPDDDALGLYTILQTLAASSLSTGFLLGYHAADDRRS